MDSVVPMDSVVLLAVIFVISTSSQLRTSSFGSLLQKNHRGSLGSFALVLLRAKEPVPIAKEPSLGDDMEILRELEDEDLRDLGLGVGHIRRFRRGIPEPNTTLL